METALSAFIISCCFFALGVAVGIIWRGRSNTLPACDCPEAHEPGCRAAPL
jgi:hypothetical protein